MKIMDADSFGQALCARRKQLHYTQAWLSEFTGFSVSFISDLERGKQTAKLYSIPELYRLFIKAKFDFSMFGLNVREKLGLSSGLFSVYRNRLMQRPRHSPKRMPAQALYNSYERIMYCRSAGLL